MTAPLWPATEAEAATGGRATGDWTATGVSIDTRTLAPGDLFVALTAARDVHEFAAKALAKGAAAVLISRDPGDLPDDAPTLMVDDVQAALERLGVAGRARTGAKVIAVTGSVGKTSTKEMLRTALDVQGRVHAAEASYNNHWGVPLTLARMPADTEYAVIEIGMSNPGEIAPLARMARPHVAMVTTVAPAHLAQFDSLEAIAHEKAAIFGGLEPDGTAVVNADLPTTPILLAAAKAAGARVVTFGEADIAHHHLIRAEVSRETTVVEGRAWRTPLLFKIGTPGRHFARNALGVLAAVSAAGADRVPAMLALGTWSPPGGRGMIERIALDIVNEHLAFELIDDAFNANPTSMGAALDTLAATDPVDGVGRVAGGRRIAVLGDMLELGAEETALHVALARHPATATVQKVHCVGPRMRALWEALPDRQRGEWTERAEDLAARAHHLVDAGDVVLVKGSKGSRVSLVVDALRRLGTRAGAPA